MLKFVKVATIISICFFLSGFSLKKSIVKAQVNKRRVKTGEIFTYKVKIEGDFTNPYFVLPKFENFRIVSRTHSKRYSFDNGKVAAAIDLTYFLFAPCPGRFTIKSAVVADSGTRHRSKAFTIKVKGPPLKDKEKILPYISKGKNI